MKHAIAGLPKPTSFSTPLLEPMSPNSGRYQHVTNRSPSNITCKTGEKKLSLASSGKSNLNEDSAWNAMQLEGGGVYYVSA